MEFMYCIPDIDVFIDDTIKKCLLEFDLDKEDTETVLDDSETVMGCPIDNENGYYEKAHNANHNTHKSRLACLETNRITDLSVLGDTQKLNTVGKMKMDKEDEHRSLNLPDSICDRSKIISSAKSVEEEGDNFRCASRESGNSTPDISDSPKLPAKLKSRLQQRYFQNSRETSPELMNMAGTENQKQRSPISPDSGHVTSSGSDYDHNLSSSPTERSSGKRSASRDGEDMIESENKDPLGNKFPDMEQPTGKMPRLIEFPSSSNSKDSPSPCQQTPKKADTNLFDLYCLAFRSSLNGSIPIETLNRSMQVPMLLKEKMETSHARSKQGPTESRETYPIATSAPSLSTSPIGNAPRLTQSHTVQSQRTNNSQELFQRLKQQLQQRNQSPINPDNNSTILTSHHQHQGLRKRRHCLKSPHEEYVATGIFLDHTHTSLISKIIAEEIMKVDDKVVQELSSPSDLRKGNASLPLVCNGSTSSNPDVITAQREMPLSTLSSQIPPLIAVRPTSWHGPPPHIQYPLDPYPQKVVPLTAHQPHVNSSTVCVVPESPICLRAFPSSPSDQYDDNVPQDLSQKSSRRKVENDLHFHSTHVIPQL